MTQRVVVAYVWYTDSKDRKERKRERNNRYQVCATFLSSFLMLTSLLLQSSQTLMTLSMATEYI